MKEALNNKAGRYDVVFSNPPYQVMDGGYKASARPIYHEIVMYAIDLLKPQYVCMITPSRWMAGGKGLDQYRARMLADKHIRLIQDFPNEKSVFPNVMIKGGVSYFLWDRNYSNDCEFNSYKRNIGEFDVLIRDNMSHQILKKVLEIHKGSFCNEKVLPSKPFGLRTFFKDWVPEGTPGSVKCHYMGHKTAWVELSRINDPNGILTHYKVCTSNARSQGITDAEGRGDPSPVLGPIFQIPKGEICTETYIVLGSFKTKKEADNYESYVKTKFFRFCLMNRLISQHVTRDRFAWVPDLKDYSMSYTDKGLYVHFDNLNPNEIAHIERTIK